MKNNNKIRPQCAKTFGELLEFKKNIEEDIDEIKETLTNHIPSELKEIKEKLSNRPSWSVLKIITLLSSLVMFLLGLIASKFL